MTADLLRETGGVSAKAPDRAAIDAYLAVVQVGGLTVHGRAPKSGS